MSISEVLFNKYFVTNAIVELKRNAIAFQRLAESAITDNDFIDLKVYLRAINYSALCALTGYEINIQERYICVEDLWCPPNKKEIEEIENILLGVELTHRSMVVDNLTVESFYCYYISTNDTVVEAAISTLNDKQNISKGDLANIISILRDYMIPLDAWRCIQKSAEIISVKRNRNIAIATAIGGVAVAGVAYLLCGGDSSTSTDSTSVQVDNDPQIVVNFMDDYGDVNVYEIS